jgi:hypothetical protein
MPDVDAIQEQLDKLGDAVEKARGRVHWTVVFPILTTVISLVIGVLSYIVDSHVKTFDEKLSASHDYTVDRQAEATLGISVYQETLAALDSKDTRKQELMLKLLNALEAGYRQDDANASIRSYIVQLETLFQAAPETKAQADFYVEDAAVAPPPVTAANAPALEQTVALLGARTLASGTVEAQGSPSGWDYDVFWCEDTPGSQETAQIVFDGLVARQAKEKLGRLRLRKLPTSINQQESYEIHDTVVIRRYPDKAAQADVLKAEVEQDLQAKGMSVTVTLAGSHQKLPFYLSVFACRSKG